MMILSYVLTASSDMAKDRLICIIIKHKHDLTNIMILNTFKGTTVIDDIPIEKDVLKITILQIEINVVNNLNLPVLIVVIGSRIP